MKAKRVEITASILTLALTVAMSGCSVSINLNNKKKEATESMETTEKKEETTDSADEQLRKKQKQQDSLTVRMRQTAKQWI